MKVEDAVPERTLLASSRASFMAKAFSFPAVF